MPSKLGPQPPRTMSLLTHALRRARFSLGWSQERCAIECRVALKTWWRWESGTDPDELALQRSRDLWPIYDRLRREAWNEAQMRRAA